MFNAVIFDFDGVVFDSEPIHLNACNNVLKSHGIVIDDKIFFTKYVGLSDQEMFPLVFKDNGCAVNQDQIEQLLKQKVNEYKKLINDHITLRSNHALLDVLEHLKKLNKKLAICSGAARDEIEVVFSKLENKDLKAFFEVIISVNDVDKGKPSPQGYLLTSKLLKVQPNCCLVLEDTPDGIKAAKSAGMFVIGLVGTVEKAKLMEADLVISHMSELLEYFS